MRNKTLIKGDSFMIVANDLKQEEMQKKGNSILNNAKYSTDNTDEWYTTYDTVAEEVSHYKDQFEGKVVLCNCDDPYESNFCYYFLKHFNQLKLKKLICTSYSGSKIEQIQDNFQLTLDLFNTDGDPVLFDRGYVLTVTKMPGMVGEEISDEEARVIKVQYIHIDTTKTKTNKATKQLEEVISLVNGGYQTFAKEAKQYSDDELVTKTIRKNEATQDYEIAAFDLANEEMSSIITQDDGLYLVYCENSYLKDETAQNKSAIIESTKNSAFSKVYDNYISDVKSDFNTSAWDDIALPDGENMVSTNIMDVFDTIAAE